MTKTAAVCTLFVGKYHYGVASLVNSLCHHGFEGTMWVGYKGDLPPWIKGVKEDAHGYQMVISERCIMHLIRVESQAHLTNYKPSFMMDIMKEYDTSTTSLYYFDPDIVINCSWKFFQDWVQCGVALCEDVNSPINLNNPRRIGWRKFYLEHGMTLHPRESSYANGGSVGITKENINFLEQWQIMTNIACESLGGSDIAGISGGRMIEGFMGFADCFRHPDQDALNAAIEMLSEIPVSFEGKQAMGFSPGKCILPHAIGSPKPWQKNYFLCGLRGLPPSTADKEFWKYSGGSLMAFSKAELLRKRVEVNLAAAFGRIYRRR